MGWSAVTKGLTSEAAEPSEAFAGSIPDDFPADRFMNLGAGQRPELVSG
jgi:hypothetical protein